VQQRTKLKRPTFKRKTRSNNRLDQQVGCNPLLGGLIFFTVENVKASIGGSFAHP
jgi:hypothetical protein